MLWASSPLAGAEVIRVVAVLHHNSLQIFLARVMNVPEGPIDPARARSVPSPKEDVCDGEFLTSILPAVEY